MHDSDLNQREYFLNPVYGPRLLACLAWRPATAPFYFVAVGVPLVYAVVVPIAAAFHACACWGHLHVYVLLSGDFGSGEKE